MRALRCGSSLSVTRPQPPPSPANSHATVVSAGQPFTSLSTFRGAERRHAGQIYSPRKVAAHLPFRTTPTTAWSERVHRRGVELREVAKARQDPEALVAVVAAVGSEIRSSVGRVACSAS